MDHISEKSKEYSLNSRDKINLSSKFNNKKKQNFISNGLNDSELYKNSPDQTSKYNKTNKNFSLIEKLKKNKQNNAVLRKTNTDITKSNSKTNIIF